MAVVRHLVLTHDRDLVGEVLVDVEAFAVGRVPGPGEDVLRVAPDEVRGAAVGVHHVDLAAVDIDRQRARAEAGLVAWGLPAVEEE